MYNLYLFLVKNNRLWMGNFSFVICADIRLDSVWPFIEHNTKDLKLQLNKAICAVHKINNITPRPQFVVICGDLVNEMPNSKLNFHTKFIIFINIYVY